MNKLNALFYCSFMLMALAACNYENENGPNQQNNTVKQKEPKPDSSLMEIANLPIYIDKTDYIIHPIGAIQVYEYNNSGILGSYRSSASNYYISSYSNYTLSGNMRNLKFEHISKGTVHRLTDKYIIIQSATFLKEIFDKNQQQILVYNVLDKDTNEDEELEDNDATSLYISEMGGALFTKLTADSVELINWNTIPIMNRLYFRTWSDKNKNKVFENEDEMGFHYLELDKIPWKVEDYHPVNESE